MVGPRPILYFDPPVKRSLKIQGYWPLLYCSSGQLWRPFRNPTTGNPMGGGMDICYWTLDRKSTRLNSSH